MNFRINFARLLREQRPDKIDQQYRFLRHITSKTAPDNAMMIYFFGLMEKKSFGKVSDITKTRLKEIIKEEVEKVVNRIVQKRVDERLE
mgnify:CR=1 FL=1